MKDSFEIKCKKCKSTNVDLIGGYDGLMGLKCLNCGHEYLTKACNI